MLGEGLVKHVMASVRELRHVLATKHLNAYAMGSNCPTPSLELAGGDLTVFPTVIWVA